MITNRRQSYTFFLTLQSKERVLLFYCRLRVMCFWFLVRFALLLEKSSIGKALSTKNQKPITQNHELFLMSLSENLTQEQEAQLGQEAKEYVLCLPMPWERKET